MKSFYCYLPLEKELVNKEEVVHLVSLILESDIDDNDDYSGVGYMNLKTRSNNKSVTVNVLSNVKFASDTRIFVRIRIDMCHSELILMLREKSVAMKGYHADNSKVFLDHRGSNVYNVIDDTSFILLSHGEIITKIEDSCDGIKKDLLKNKEYLVELYQKKFDVMLTIEENSQYSLPIKVQKNQVSYNLELN
jgi:hypothetical protein